MHYKGYLIIPLLQKINGTYQTQAVIRRQTEDATLEVRFMRADMHQSREQLQDDCYFKGRRIIDEQGESMFQKQRV